MNGGLGRDASTGAGGGEFQQRGGGTTKNGQRINPPPDSTMPWNRNRTRRRGGWWWGRGGVFELQAHSNTPKITLSPHSKQCGATNQGPFLGRPSRGLQVRARACLCGRECYCPPTMPPPRPPTMPTLCLRFAPIRPRTVPRPFPYRGPALQQTDKGFCGHTTSPARCLKQENTRHTNHIRT